MPDRRCCCTGTGPCCEVSDNFNRANSTDIGEDWVECSGDWSIASNQLSISGIGFAVYRQTCETLGAGSVEMCDLSANRKYRLIAGLGAVEGGTGTGTGGSCEDDWIAAQYEVDGTGFGATVSLIKSVSGTISVLAYEETVNGTAPYTLNLCVGESRIQAYTDDTTYPLSDCGAPIGDYWGLASAASGTHLFDDFRVQEHYLTNNTCPQCECGCEGFCFPATMTATLENAVACSQLDGVSFPITLNGYCSWKSAEQTGNCVGSVNDSISIEFHPSTSAPPEYQGPAEYWDLIVWRYISETIFDEVSGSANEGSTCDPLYLIFGPFEIAGHPDSDDLCCEGQWVWDEELEDWVAAGEPAWGSFYVIITE